MKALRNRTPQLCASSRAKKHVQHGGTLALERDGYSRRKNKYPVPFPPCAAYHSQNVFIVVWSSGFHHPVPLGLVYIKLCQKSYRDPTSHTYTNRSGRRGLPFFLDMVPCAPPRRRIMKTLETRKGTLLRCLTIANCPGAVIHIDRQTLRVFLRYIIAAYFQFVGGTSHLRGLRKDGTVRCTGLPLQTLGIS